MQFDRFINLTADEKRQFAAEGSFERNSLVYWPWKTSKAGESWFYAIERAGESHPGVSADDKEFSYPMIHGGPVAVEFETNKPPSHLMMASAEDYADAEIVHADDDDESFALPPDWAQCEEAADLQRQIEAAANDAERRQLWEAWLMGDFS